MNLESDSGVGNWADRRLVRIKNKAGIKHLGAVKLWFAVCLLLSGVLLALNINAMPAGVLRGLDWLQTQVTTAAPFLDEVVGAEPSNKSSKRAASPQIQCETARTLVMLANGSPQINNLIVALETGDVGGKSTENTACADVLRQLRGQPTGVTTVGRAQASGAFAAFEGYRADSALDTAWALEAFASSPNASNVNQLLSWLQVKQKADGSFAGPSAAGRSNQGASLMMTAVLLRGIRPVVTQSAVAAGIAAKAAAYLIAQRASNTGMWLNDVAITALVFETIHPYTGVDPQIARQVASYLQANQLPDGSWAGDVYVTALALRAWALTEVSPINPLADVNAATVKGVVSHAVTGELLAGATVQLLPSAGNASTVQTNASGQYTISVSSFGGAVLVASSPGFQSVTASLSLIAKGQYVFSPSLYPVGQGANTTTAVVWGKVQNQDAGTALAGVRVSVSDASNTFALSDSSGNFTMTVAAGNYTATYSLTGFGTATQQVLLPGGSRANLGVINLKALQTTSTFRGVVNSNAGQSIAVAKILEINSGATVISNSAGAYSIAGLSGNQFTWQVSAPGYITRTYGNTVSAPGDYQQNFVLAASTPDTTGTQPPGILSSSNLTLGASSLNANTDLTVTVLVTNSSGQTASALVRAEITDPLGKQIAYFSGHSDDGNSMSSVTLAPGQSTRINYKWNSARFSAGVYDLGIVLVEPGSMSTNTPRGKVIDSLGGARFSINPFAAFSGSLTANPPVVRAGVSTTVSISALIQNVGNVVLPATIYELRVVNNASGQVALARTMNGTELPFGQLLPLSLGSWQPADSGSYRLELTAASAPGSSLTTTLYVGQPATAIYTVDKSIVPTGNQNVRGKIQITGADVATGVLQDPLAPLVKQAITKAVNYADNLSYNHYVNDLRCFACHVQTQAVVGGERSLKFTPSLNPLKRSALMDAITKPMASTGYVPYENSEAYAVINTTLGLWAASAWHNVPEIINSRQRMASYLMSRQQPDGAWPVEHPYAWWRTPSPITALNLESFASLSKLISQTPTLAITMPATKPIDLGAIPSGGQFIRTAPDGTIYFANWPNNQVLVKPPGGTVSVLSSGQNIATVLPLADGSLLMASHIQGVLHRKTDGTVSVINSQPVWDIAQYSDNEFVATAASGYNLYKFKLDGTLTNFFSFLGQGSYARGLAVQADGTVIVGSYEANRILRIAANGQFVDSPIPFTGGTVLAIEPYRDGYLISSGSGVHYYNKNWVSERLSFTSAFSVGILPGDRIVASSWAAGEPPYEIEFQPVDTVSVKHQLDASIDRAATWLVAGSGIDSNNNIDVAFRLIGLARAKEHYKGTARYSEFDTLMLQLGDTLWSRQRADGGWVWREGGYSTSDSMVTAMVGIALDLLNPSKDDPKYRKIIELLLSRQQADGGWSSENNLVSPSPNLYLVSSTWVEIFLPTLLDRLGGIDVDVTANFAPNVAMSNPSISATTVTLAADGSTQVMWKLKSVTGDGQAIDFDLALANMQIDETRKASSSAYLQFGNTFVNESVTMAIDIPTIKAVAQLGVSVNTDKPSYGAAETVFISAPIVSTAAITRDALVRYTIKDDTGRTVEVLPQAAPISVNAGATTTHTQTWFTSGTLAGNYSVLAELVSPQGVVYGSASASFAIQAGVAQLNGARISSDRISYTAAQPVTLISRVSNNSVNTPQDNVSAVTWVTNAAGASFFNASEPIVQLSASGLRQYPYSLPAGSLPSGSYTAYLQLKNAQGSVLASSSTSFAVVASDISGIGLQGQLSAPTAALIGTTVAFKLTATNNGNATPSNAPVSINLVDPSTGALVATTSQTFASWTVGQTQVIDWSWLVQGRAGQQLVASASALVGGKTISLGQSVISLLALSGQVGGQPNPAPAGQPISLLYSINNPATYAYSGPFKLDVRNAQGTSLTSYQFNATIGANASYSGNQVMTAPNAAQTLTLVLSQLQSTGAASASTVLATSSLQISKAPDSQPPGISMSFAEDARILVLVSCPVGQGANANDDAACVARRSLGIARYLDSLGMTYKIVTDQASFVHEMRCGIYNAYWISGGALKLSAQTVQEVREAVWRGDGLIVDGIHDSRNQLLHATLGVKQNGKLPQTGYTASVPAAGTPTSLFGADVPTGSLATLGQPTKFDLLTGQTQASFPAQGNQGHVPAIVSNRYGAGNSILFAFDFADMLAQQPGQPVSSQLQAMVATTADHIASDSSANLSASDTVLVRISVANPAANATLAGATLSQSVTVDALLPEGASHVNAQPSGNVHANTVSWQIDVPAGSSKDILWRIKLGAAQTGSFVIRAQARNAAMQASQVSSASSLGAAVQAASQWTAAPLPAVQALVVSNPDSQRKNKAIAAINSATALMAQAKYVEAIAQWVEAANQVTDISSANTEAAHTAIAKALEVATDAQCQALACIQGSVSMSPLKPLLGTTLTVARTVTNSCPSPLIAMPAAASLRNLHLNSVELNFVDSLTLNPGSSNTRQAGWLVKGPLQGGSNAKGDVLEMPLWVDWQGHRIELDRKRVQICTGNTAAQCQ